MERPNERLVLSAQLLLKNQPATMVGCIWKARLVLANWNGRGVFPCFSSFLALLTKQLANRLCGMLFEGGAMRTPGGFKRLVAGIGERRAALVEPGRKRMPFLHLQAS